MPLNIEVDDEVAQRLQGTKVILSAPEQVVNMPFGRTVLEDVEAVMTPIGLVVAFELTRGELRAFKEGKNQFLIHFFHADKLPPFRILMEDYDEQAEEGTVIRFPESNGDSAE